MRLPKGCDILTGKVVLLNKAVYGLKQAGRQWNLKLVKTFTDEMGLDQSKSVPCLFKMMRGDRVVLITAVHVDDMIVAAETEYLCDWTVCRSRCGSCAPPLNLFIYLPISLCIYLSLSSLSHLQSPSSFPLRGELPRALRAHRYGFCEQCVCVCCENNVHRYPSVLHDSSKSKSKR